MKTATLSEIATPAELHPADRIPWVDLLRVVACALVVLAHCCDSFVGAFDTDRTAFITGSAIGSLTRPSVPLFVMMTAILLLPMPQGCTMRSFYKKRIGRIIPPLIFWSIALPVLFHIYYSLINPATLNPTIDVPAYTTGNLLNKIWLMVFNFNFDTVPLWYLYMLVGLYMIMPVLNAWMTAADKKDLRIFLYIWGFTLFIPYLKLLAPHVGYQGNFGSMEIFGACDWNAYGTFYYMTGFIGYIVLTYYLRRFPLSWTTPKMLAVCLPMFAVGYLITFGGFVRIQDFFPGDYSYLEVIWYFTGINVFMMTFPVLALCSRIKMRPRRWISALARLSFGIYLCHFIFVYISFDIFNALTIHPALKIFAMALCSFSAAAILSWLMSLTRFTKRFVA
jgi:surface polysaccharide O-acyltransferase-like enzyme